MAPYDPFQRGRYPVGVRALHAHDAARARDFPCEIWYPAEARYASRDLSPETQDSFTTSPDTAPRTQQAVRDAAACPGTYPLVVFSHHSGGNRRAATFLCTHLSSHGYVTAALDHSEVIAPELAPSFAENSRQKIALARLWAANRVADVRFLLDRLLGGETWEPAVRLDGDSAGIVGHSFGGWTALAAPDTEPRIAAVVALAPGGNSRPRPGIIRSPLAFAWLRAVPTLYLAAADDVPIPLEGVYELFDLTPAAKRMAVLRRADHLHFVDNVAEAHESMRKRLLTGELSWISEKMRPIAELCPPEQAHNFVRGLTLSHLDATLRQFADAQQFLAGDLARELALRGINAFIHPR